MYMRPADTSPEAWRVFLELQRKMSPGDKLRAVFEYSIALAELAESDIRSKFPEAGEEEVFLWSAARRLGRELMIKVYGWDPNTNARVRDRRKSSF